MTRLVGESVVEAASTRLREPNAGGTAQGHPTSAGLEHAVFASFSEARALQQSWDSFVEEAGGDIFSTFDWCEVWWRHYGQRRRLQIHVFHDAGRLVAVLPLFWERLRLGPLSLRLVRLVGCDHSVTTCAPVIQPDRMAAVMAAVVESLERGSPWDLLYLGPLPGYYERRDTMAGALRGCAGVEEVVSSADDGPHIVFNLPLTYEAYLGTLSSSERHNIRKRDRRLAENHRSRLVVIAPDKIEQAFRSFVRQHQAQWQRQGQLGHFGDWPGARAYHHDMALAQSRCGRLMLLHLEADDETLGFHYSYRFGQHVHWILGSRTLDPRWEFYSPGRLLHCAMVREALEAGATQIDAMRGMYDYKLRLGGTVLQLQSVAAIHEGLMSRLRVRTTRCNARLLDLFYYRIWFGRLAARLPYWQRPLWRTWIRSRI